MTAPLKNLDQIYHRITPPHESSLERWATKFALLIILACAVFIMLMIYQAKTAPPPTIREITPAERRQVGELEKKYKLTGLVWSIDRQTGEVAYYRKGAWRIIQ